MSFGKDKVVSIALELSMIYLIELDDKVRWLRISLLIALAF